MGSAERLVVGNSGTYPGPNKDLMPNIAGESQWYILACLAMG